MTEIMAIGERRNNAELMADCAALGYLPEPVIDLTYGLGRFWTLHRPAVLFTNDIDPTRTTDFTLDFTNLGDHFPEGHFAATVFDPPYKLNGTSKPRGPATSDAAYGVDGDYMPMGKRHKLMVDGLREAIRITRTDGFVLVKCQDQVSSGRVRWQTDLMTETAVEAGAEKVDLLHVRGYRQQPPGRTQKHARRDYSSLLVFKVK